LANTRGLALVATLMVLASAVPARARDDSTRDEFWPEVDAYVGLGEGSRLFFLASVTRNREDDVLEGMVGGHVDFVLKPILRASLHDSPDVFKRRYLAFRAGYRYAWDLQDNGSYREHRGVLEVTARTPSLRGFVFMNRNRLDLREVEGEGSWRYRNRTRVERDLALGARAATPYVMAEFFYDSRYHAWSRQRYFAGIEWPLGKMPILDTYYCRQNDSHSSVAHVNAFGLAINLFF
jgi:Protein of unknown function (DUF2490)